MKILKKMFSLVMAFMMVLSIAESGIAEKAGAEEKYTLTLEGLAGHDLELYQIFTGDLDKAGGKVLSNIRYGSSWKNKSGQEAGEDVLNKLKGDNEKDKQEKALKFAKENISKLTPVSNVKTEENSNAKYENLAPGYYLVKDKDGTQNKENGAYTLYVLQVVGDTTAKKKYDVPTVKKFVKDINDSNGNKSGWQKTADHDIDDLVEFRLEAALPSNYEDYKSYKLVFHDIISKGLTFNKESVKVYKNSEDKNNLITDKFVVDSAENGFTVSVEDLKKAASDLKNNDRVIVTYSAKLNKDAVIGEKGNPNEVYLEYSNNPNTGGEGETGKTPEDKVIVFTYEVDVNKVNEEKKPLSGAGFTLYKKYAGEEKENSYSGDIKTGNDVYVKVAEINAGSGDEKNKFSFKGVDDGEYILVESRVPAGYNKMKDMKFTVTSEHGKNNELKLDSLKAEGFEKDGDSGILKTDVVNKAGSTLPETGGVGTKLMYAAGIIAVLGAAIYLIADKKVSERKR